MRFNILFDEYVQFRYNRVIPEIANEYGDLLHFGSDLIDLIEQYHIEKGSYYSSFDQEIQALRIVNGARNSGVHAWNEFKAYCSDSDKQHLMKRYYSSDSFVEELEWAKWYPRKYLGNRKMSLI
eukprot:UN06941